MAPGSKGLGYHLESLSSTEQIKSSAHQVVDFVKALFRYVGFKKAFYFTQMVFQRLLFQEQSISKPLIPPALHIEGFENPLCRVQESLF